MFFKINSLLSVLICGIFLFCVFSVFSGYSLAFADTIPPLPIEDLKKIELKYNDTLTKVLPIDTFYFKVYGGLPKSALGGKVDYFQGELKIKYPIKKKILVAVNGRADKNYDYCDYFSWMGKFDIGWLTKTFWHEFNLSAMRKIKGERYYENAGIKYNPIWFISNGTIHFNNQLRTARYTGNQTNYFLTANSEISFTKPSIVGMINSKAAILFQSTDKILAENPVLAKIALNDLITFGDNLFIKPGVNYEIKKERLGINFNSGILIDEIITFFDLAYNSVKPFYFDTVYSNVFPYLVNRNLDYPICNWDMGLSLLWKDFQLFGNYKQFSKYRNWARSDTWIIPETIDTTYQEISVSLQNKWRFIKNTLGFDYTPILLNLMPIFIITDSLQIRIRKFEFSANIFISGRRNWDNLTMPNYFLCSSQVAYNWKFLKMLGRVENIFDEKYEILPSKSDRGRKYFIGLEMKNTTEAQSHREKTEK